MSDNVLTLIQPTATNLTDNINAFLAFQAATCTPRTIHAYKERLNTFVRWLAGRDPTKEVITLWVSEIGPGVSKNTLAAYHRTLNVFWNWCKDQGFVAESPMPKVRIGAIAPVVERAPINSFEYGQLVTWAVEHPGYWLYAIKLAWGTGLRLGDIALLKWESVDLIECRLKLKPSKTARLGKIVEIPMTPAVSSMLREIWKHGAKHPDGYVHAHMAQCYLKTRHCGFSQGFKNICQHLGIRHRTFHCFRHAFVTRHLDAGVNPAVIASMTGHTLEQIMTYSHVSLETKRRALVMH